MAVVATAEASSNGDPQLPYVETILDPAAFTRAARYYEAALADLGARLRQAGTELMVVDLIVAVDLGEDAAKAQQRLSGFLEGACERLDLRCTSTAGLFDDCTGCFLPGDGHFSAKGNRTLAAWLAAPMAGKHP